MILPCILCPSLVAHLLPQQGKLPFAEFSPSRWLLTGHAPWQSLLIYSHRGFSCLSSGRHPVSQTSETSVSCQITLFPRDLTTLGTLSISVLLSPHYRRWSCLLRVSLFSTSPSPYPRVEPFEGRVLADLSVFVISIMVAVSPHLGFLGNPEDRFRSFVVRWA